MNIIILSSVTYNSIHSGRTKAIVDELIKKNIPVTFVEPPISIAGYLKGKTVNNIGNLLSRFFTTIRYKQKLHIISFPLILPLGRFNLANKLNTSIVRKKLLRCLYKITNQNTATIFIITNPYWYSIANCLKGIICYDCIDDVRVFSGVSKVKLYTKWHIDLIKRANIIFVSALKIKKDIISINPQKAKNLVYLPNAVDNKWFRQRAKNSETPEELKKISKPIIGFIGLIYWWIDMELIYDVATKLPNYSFVFVGPISQKVRKLPNIYFLGPKPYNEIPVYINTFDICIAPFKINDVGDAVDPLKVYEYLALGKPVIASDIEELRKLDNLIYIAKNDTDFVNCIEKALKEKKEDLEIKRQKYAELNSWEARVDTMLQTISGYLEDKKLHCLKQV
jgi:glycosyltransferase involved in cell wall biosynthesis